VACSAPARVAGSTIATSPALNQAEARSSARRRRRPASRPDREPRFTRDEVAQQRAHPPASIG
jgi:hypothetical protein